MGEQTSEHRQLYLHGTAAFQLVMVKKNTRHQLYYALSISLICGTVDLRKTRSCLHALVQNDSYRFLTMCLLLAAKLSVNFT